MDVNYFKQKLNLVVDGLINYAGDELARELHRLANTASVSVHKWTEADELSQSEAEKAELAEALESLVDNFKIMENGFNKTLFDKARKAMLNASPTNTEVV